MLAQDVLKPGTGHRLAACVEEQFRCERLAAYRQPGPKIGGGVFPQRQTALAPPFALDTDTGG